MSDLTPHEATRMLARFALAVWVGNFLGLALAAGPFVMMVLLVLFFAVVVCVFAIADWLRQASEPPWRRRDE